MAAPGRGAYTLDIYGARTFNWPPVTAISGRHRRHSSGHRRIPSRFWCEFRAGSLAGWSGERAL